MKALLLLLVVGLMGGCGKTVLYSELNEQQGNEMLALLLQNNIISEKRPGKDNMVSLLVASENIPQAVQLLGQYGYPKRQFTTIGDVFNADKLIATPYEDHTRYTYALSQELADTLSQLDGVMTARIHLVVPQESDDSDVSSAAVFIKHNPNYPLDEHIPQMRSIVASAIEGLGYESVNVALFPARPTGPLDQAEIFDGGPSLRSVLSLKLAAESVLGFYSIVGALLVLLVLSLCVNVYLFLIERPKQEENES